MEQDTKDPSATTTTTTTTPSTALARPEGRPEGEIDRARVANLVAATIGSLSWGANMDQTMRRAFAEYCRRYDVDPVTEMDNLGGTPYVNADWFKRKLGELRITGHVKEVRLEHIQADPRLDALRQDQSAPEEMRAEASRRWFDALFKRIAHNAPDKAEAICLCTIVLANGSTVVGCKWAGNGTSVRQPRGGGASAPNPIAENNAVLYAESASIRRAAIQLFSHLTGQRLSEGTLPTLPDPATMSAEHQELRAAIASLPAGLPVEPPAEPERKRLPVAAEVDGAYGLTETVQSRGGR